MKESDVHVRSEYIDIAEGRIPQAGDGAAIMQELPDLVSAFSHHLKPLACNGSQFTGMRLHPRINRGIPLDSAVEAKQLRSLHRWITNLPRSLKERLHDVNDTIGTVDDAKVAPFIKRKTWMRDIEADHVAHVNIGAFVNLQKCVLIHDAR